MPTRLNRGRYLTLTVLIVIAVALYAAWDPVMDWLRMTLHGR